MVHAFPRCTHSLSAPAPHVQDKTSCSISNNCNVVECGYLDGHCSLENILTKCLLEDNEVPTLSDNPHIASGLPDRDFGVTLRLALAASSTWAVDEDTNRVHWATRLVTEISWTDPRLTTAACRGVFNRVLGEADATQIADFKRSYYLPEFEVNNLARKPIPTFPAREVVELNETTGDVTLTRAGVITLEQLNGDADFGRYTRFPSDSHVLRLFASTSPKARRAPHPLVHATLRRSTPPPRGVARRGAAGQH